MRPKQESEKHILIRAYLTRKRVLFRITTDNVERVGRIPGYSIGNDRMIGNTYPGRVIQMHRIHYRAQVESTFFNHRLAIWVGIADIVAVYDIYQGTRMTIGRNSGVMVDLRTAAEKAVDEHNPDL